MALSQHGRAVVLYESMFGNTAAIADAVARGLQHESLEVACSEVGAADAVAPLDADLLVIGAPTHYFSLSTPGTREDAVRRGAPSECVGPGIREWLAGVAGRPGPVVATFDTRLAVMQRIPVAAATVEARLAKQRGLRLLSEPTGFLVVSTSGPLCDGEILRAQSWGRSLAAELKPMVDAASAEA